MVRRAAVTLIIGLFGAVPCAGEDDPPKAQANSSNVIAVDLNAATQVGRVLFDVPIVIRLSLESDITSVRVYQSTPSRHALCDAGVPFTLANVWTRFSLDRSLPGPTGSDPKTDAFLTISPIDANRHVCFKFEVTRRLAADEIQALTAGAVKTADEALRIDSDAGFTSARIENTRQSMRLLLGIAAPLAGHSVRRDVAEGSVLSERPTPVSQRAFTGFLRDVLSSALARAAAVDSLIGQSTPPGLATQAADAIARLAGNAILGDYQTRINAAAQSDAALAAQFAQANAAIFQLRALANGASPHILAGRAYAIAVGIPIDIVNPQPFRDVWTAAGMDPHIAIAQTWLVRLQQLQEYVQRQPPTVQPPFATAAISALRAHVADAEARLESAMGALLLIRQALDERADALKLFASRIGNLVVADAFVGTSSFADFNTRSLWYMSVDAGLASAPNLNRVFPYVGGNIYFGPVNKDAPLSLRGGWRRRLSAVVGASYQTNLEREGELENSLGSRMLMLGAGWRITDILRFGAGVVVVNAVDPNPLITRDSRAEWTPFFSLSVDWDARTTFQKAFTDTNK